MKTRHMFVAENNEQDFDIICTNEWILTDLWQLLELVSVSFQCRCGIMLPKVLSYLKESIAIFSVTFAFLVKNITKESVNTRTLVVFMSLLFLKRFAPALVDHHH